MAAQASIETTVLTEDEFDYHFELEMNDNGSVVMTEEEVANSSPSHIWTIIKHDGNTYLVSGFHYADAVGYALTEQPVGYGEFYEVQMDF